MRFAVLVSALTACDPVAAQTSFPMVSHALPLAVRRGATAEVVVHGTQNFAGVHKVLFDGPGVSAEPVEAGPKAPAAPTSAALRVRVDADAPLGPREFRLASRLGLSSVGQLLVVDDPVVEEKGDNNTPAKALAVPLPCVACGRVEAVEDVDCYRFRARSGVPVTVEVQCARLQDKIHDLQKHADPLVTVLAADGRELAAADDARFADPVLSFTPPSDGEYVLTVRDSKYEGDPRWAYAVTLSDRPYAAHFYPLGVNPGRRAAVEVIGAGRNAEVTAPATTGVHRVAAELPDGRTNPAALVVSPLPLVEEAEPNDERAAANRIAVPCGVNGRIGRPRDVDHFVFRGEKGKAVKFEAFARRFGTDLAAPIDTTLDVFGPGSSAAPLASNDDGNGKDAMLMFTPPADGDYVVRIRDLNSKGGPAGVYFLAAEYAGPDFALRCDSAKAMIGPGNRTAWYAHVTRLNGFDGPVKVEVRGLPAGVSASSLTIPPNMTQGVVVLSASADAAVDAARVEVVGTADLAGGATLARTATANEEIYLPGGGRGRFDVALQAAAVTGPSDVLDVSVSPERVTLKPGQEVRLDVTVKRRDDFNKPVNLDVRLRHGNQSFGDPLPPGVTVIDAKSKTLLPPGVSKGHVTLKAAANATPAEGVPVCVLAHVSVNFVVKVSYSSPALPLSVGK